METEKSLSALIRIPEAKQMLGSALTFEIEALYCNPFGPNLRNALAHGLIGDSDCDSAYSIYAWWLVLKLVIGGIESTVSDGSNG